jgi:uncharacterized protein
MNTRLVIIQPTPLCNIDCRYCYLPDRTSNKRISQETLTRIFETLFSSSSVSGKVRITWHAGEPLTLPVSFYAGAFELASRLNTRGVAIRHAFQTNGTLIDQAWCDLIKAHGVDVGVSIDGPQDLHDLNRVDRAGRGTFRRTMRGIDLLQQNGIPVHVIMVLTRPALERADEIWHFFMELGIRNLAFNVEEVEGVHRESSMQPGHTMRAYRDFLTRIAILRDNHPTPVRVRELDELLARVQQGAGAPQSSLSSPMGTLSFDWQGNFSTFSPELLAMRHPLYGSFVFGNVATDALDSMQTHPNFVRIHGDIQRGIERCAASCDYFLLCGGGTPSNKLWERGSFDATETMHCRLRIKATSGLVLDYLEQRLGLADPGTARALSAAT